MPLPTTLNIWPVCEPSISINGVFSKTFVCLSLWYHRYTNLTGIGNDTYIRITPDVTFFGYIQVL